MAFDSNLASDIMLARRGEQPVPDFPEPGRHSNMPGFGYEQVQPPQPMVLSFPTDSLRAFILKTMGLPALVSSPDGEPVSGGSGGGGTGGGQIVGPAAGLHFGTWQQDHEPEGPDPYPHPPTGTAGIPFSISLWPPMYPPAGPFGHVGWHGGPPGVSQQTAWTPAAFAASNDAPFLLAASDARFPEARVLVPGSGQGSEIDGGGGGTFEIPVQVQMSVSVDGSGIKLLNDEAAPGNREFYCTDGAGTKGWRAVAMADLPADIAVAETFALQGDLTPAQITADQNDYNPAGLADAAVLRLSSDASRNITGLAGGADGRLLKIFNIGSNPIVFVNNSGSSAAANRFDIPADLTLNADESALAYYDATDSRWRLSCPPFKNTVGFDRLRTVSTGVVLGRSTAGSGDVEQLTLGANMTLVGGVLNSVGGVGSGDMLLGTAQTVTALKTFEDGTLVVEAPAGADTLLASAATSNTVITFPDDSGTVSLEGHTHTLADITDDGTMAAQNANSVTITGGSVTGITDLAVADGGTGASDAATARTNLGIVNGDVVYAPTPADVAINSVTDITINTRNVTGVAAGDQIIVEADFVILNNSGAARVYVFTIDFDGLFDVEFTTGSMAASSTLMHPFRVRAVCNVRATNLAYMVAEAHGQLTTGLAAGADVTMAATMLQQMSWGSTTSDATGTCTVDFKIRSANATATQTCRLIGYTIRKVSPT